MTILARLDAVVEPQRKQMAEIIASTENETVRRQQLRESLCHNQPLCTSCT